MVEGWFLAGESSFVTFLQSLVPAGDIFPVSDNNSEGIFNPWNPLA